MKNKAKTSNFKKDYLTSQEIMELMMMVSLKQSLETVISDWSKRNTFEGSDSKNLKTANTFLTKFLQSLFDRTDSRELEKINRKMKVNTVRLYDKFQIDLLNRKIEESYAKTVLDSEQYCKFCEEIMDVRCNDCNKDWKECELYTLFDNTMAPESGFSKPNCKYAYKYESK